MRTSTKIWLILAIISNVALFYFFRPLIDSIKYVRFVRTQPLNRQIFFSTIPPTVTFVFLMLFIFTINVREQTDIVTAVRVGLGIFDSTSRYIWMIVIVLAYALFLYLTYSNLAKPVRKIERAVEVLRDGKTKKPIKLGNSKQFLGIEYDLNQINENYKQQEKLIKQLTPEKEEVIVENKKVVKEVKPEKTKK